MKTYWILDRTGYGWVMQGFFILNESGDTIGPYKTKMEACETILFFGGAACMEGLK